MTIFNYFLIQMTTNCRLLWVSAGSNAVKSFGLDPVRQLMSPNVIELVPLQHYCPLIKKNNWERDAKWRNNQFICDQASIELCAPDWEIVKVASNHLQSRKALHKTRTPSAIKIKYSVPVIGHFTSFLPFRTLYKVVNARSGMQCPICIQRTVSAQCSVSITSYIIRMKLNSQGRHGRNSSSSMVCVTFKLLSPILNM